MRKQRPPRHEEELTEPQIAKLELIIARRRNHLEKIKSLGLLEEPFDFEILLAELALFGLGLMRKPKTK